MNCTVCGKWFETTACPGPHTFVVGPPIGAYDAPDQGIPFHAFAKMLQAENDRLLAEVDALAARLVTADGWAEQLHAFLSNVSGALVDAGTVKVGNESTYADGVRALTAERDALAARVRELEVYEDRWEGVRQALNEMGEEAMVAHFADEVKAMRARVRELEAFVRAFLSDDFEDHELRKRALALPRPAPPTAD